MLSRDVNIHDVDARHYVNLRRLLEPEYQAYRGNGGQALPLVVILDKGKPIKAVRADRGLTVSDMPRGPSHGRGPLVICQVRDLR